MTISLNRLGDAISSIHDEPTLSKMLAEVTVELGFDSYAYLNLQTNRTLAVSNYSKEWQTRYFQSKYDKVDPVLAAGKSKMRVFAWSSEAGQKNASGEVKRFWSEAIEFDIRSGITIPVRTGHGHMSMLTFASRRERAGTDCEIDAVTAAALVGQLHGRMEALKVAPTCQNELYLRPKEVSYLRWAAEGKSMEEIAAIHGVKYNSVKINFENAKKRFNALTLTQLVALAIRQGLI